MTEPSGGLRPITPTGCGYRTSRRIRCRKSGRTRFGVGSEKTLRLCSVTTAVAETPRALAGGTFAGQPPPDAREVLRRGRGNSGCTWTRMAGFTFEVNAVSERLALAGHRSCNCQWPVALTSGDQGGMFSLPLNPRLALGRSVLLPDQPPLATS
jgi:hypothetical protein